MIGGLIVSGVALGAEDVPARHGSSRVPVPVKVVEQEGQFRLLRDAKPYWINGAGGDGSLRALAEAGANSVRTWGAENADRILDEAESLGLTVALGIWLGHERHGFDYNAPHQVATQYEKVRETILRCKDHPALLMWGIGNEMEGEGKNAAIWSAVNNLACMAKNLDPHHPTMTVIADVGGDKVKNVHRLCPDIDIVGINSYGGIVTVPQRYKEAGGSKPYVVTEFGPPGQWEIAKTNWGAAPELTSGEKAEVYRRAYNSAIASQEGFCLGSYAFLWGHKQEATATWFGLLLPDGSRTAAVDVLTELWSGRRPANLSPTVTHPKIQGSEVVKPGAAVVAAIKASDPDGDPIAISWVLQREAAAYGSGGDAEPVPPAYPDAISQNGAERVEVRMPEQPGGYRLFAYVRDDHGGAAVANIPLLVEGPLSSAKAKPAKLPLVVYDEAGEKPPYVASGYMGHIQAIKLEPNCTENPHSGKTCLRVEYRANDGWGGVAWQDPPNCWGDTPGGYDLTGATRLTFWARGAQGGEKVSFEFGLIRRDKKYFDTASGKQGDVTLASDWREISLDLRGKDLSRIKTGFVWVVAGQGQPLTFYLDGIRFE